MSSFDFKNKVVIVTGAGRGIGEEIALQFGLAKAQVLVAGLHLEECQKVAKKITAAKGSAIAVACDVSQKKEVLTLFQVALKKFGAVDVLVNNAGVYPFTPFKDMTEEQWDKVLDVNLKGTFLCAKEAVAQMAKQKKGGNIVNISSIAALRGYPGLVHYCASKGGMDGFTRALAVEVAAQKIRVNAILPGPIRTPGIGAVDEKVLAGIVSTVPLGRIGEPIDIAEATLFLASDKASYITGQTLVIDGGSVVK